MLSKEASPFHQYLSHNDYQLAPPQKNKLSIQVKELKKDLKIKEIRTP